MHPAASWIWWSIVPGLLSTERMALPDLLVTAIEVSDGGRQRLVEPTAGSNVAVMVEVENRSSTGAPDVSVVCRRSITAGGPHQAQATVRTGPLSPNAKKTVSLTLSGATSAGPGSMWCIADGGNYVAEGDERNNTLTQSFVTHANDPNAFAIELRNFRPWVEEPLGHRRLVADVVNVSNRGAISPPPSGVRQRVRWQAVCQLPAMPWVRIRTAGDMRYYAGGDLPLPGQSARAQFWLDGLELYPYPPVSNFPATLQLACTLTTGAFMPNMPVVHQGVKTIEPDWAPAPKWWSKPVVYTIANPESKTYRPPQDVAITGVTVSGSQTADTPPLVGQHNYARIALELRQSVPRLDVACSAGTSSSGPLNRTGVVYNAGTSAMAVINLGMLAQGTNRIRCVADPLRKIAEPDTMNNVRLATATVLPPGPDLAIAKIHVRDAGRYSLVAPTAGSKMRVYAEVENRTGGSAPDNVLTCGQSTMRGGPVLETGNVKTGPIGGGAKKTLTLDMTTRSAGPGSIACTIDATDGITEPDEANNTLAEDFAIFADVNDAFEVDLTNFQPWFENRPGTRTLRATLVNKSGRGPALPSLASTPHRLRWQAVCHLMQMPWVRVRTAGDMRYYAGGDLPAPGGTASVSFWLDGIGVHPWPQPSTMPKTVNLACTLTTGAFMPNMPMVHQGDKLPQPDWAPAPKWWSKSVVYTIANPDSRVP